MTVKYEKEGRTIAYVIFTMNNLENSRNEESMKEAQRRYYNTEREIEPDFKLFDRFL